MAELHFSEDAFDEILHSPGVMAEIERRTKAVEEACNNESSWGGYASEVDEYGSRVRGRVWSYSRSCA